ncbi:uncharacterized protein LOC132405930 [Hypanus sabinus]|uniref:uncharacterized protein LOC132405930 n=1 Tax=Hypanus sabinus TaxID=79690 RepID=UPI0028C3F027|nr:uncharacterized protein LOC132405930 [Hypanus sabinus]
MAHDPTYTNFHIARGSAEDENVYSNFCNHQRGSAALRGKQGWRREVTCGGWTILCGRACIIYSTVAIIFFTTLFLLISCLTSVKNLNKKMENTHKEMLTKMMAIHNNLTLNQQTVPQLGEHPHTTPDEVTRLNSTVSQLKELWRTIQAEMNNSVSQLSKLQQTIQAEVTRLNSSVSQLSELPQTVRTEVNHLNSTVSQLREEVKRLNSSGCNDLYQNVSTFSEKYCFSSDKSGCCNAGKNCTLIKLQIAVDNEGGVKVCSKTNDSNSDSTETRHETTSVSSFSATSSAQGNSRTQN